MATENIAYPFDVESAKKIGLDIKSGRNNSFSLMEASNLVEALSHNWGGIKTEFELKDLFQPILGPGIKYQFKGNIKAIEKQLYWIHRI